MAGPLLPLAVLCAVVRQFAAVNSACPRDGACGEEQADEQVSLLQTSSLSHHKDGGDVLYMVKSYKGFYDTKLRALLQTWGSTLRPSSLLVLGDEDWAEFPISKASMCGSDATQGLACRVAYGMTVAAKAPGNWSWLYVVDDDHYVQPPMVERTLAKFDASKLVAGGCYTCGVPKYCDGQGGFCGGCGYFLSRAAVRAMVGDDSAAFMAFHGRISGSKKSDGREDMAISCALRERVPDVQIESMPPHMHGGQPNLKTLQPEQDETLSWHHISPEMMRQIYQVVVKGASLGN